MNVFLELFRQMYGSLLFNGGQVSLLVLLLRQHIATLIDIPPEPTISLTFFAVHIRDFRWIWSLLHLPLLSAADIWCLLGPQDRFVNDISGLMECVSLRLVFLLSPTVRTACLRYRFAVKHKVISCDVWLLLYLSHYWGRKLTALIFVVSGRNALLDGLNFFVKT